MNYTTISWSGGKDSTATVIKAHEEGLRIDEIVYCELMFSNSISAEFPEHLEFIHETAIPTFESWGFPVTIIRGRISYLEYFNKIYSNSSQPELNGLKYGFALNGRCRFAGKAKTPVLNKYLKTADVVYLGIAADEPERLARLKPPKISLLAKYGITESAALQMCKTYSLLSPIYRQTARNGCWFCPNASLSELRFLYFKHRDLWDKLAALEDDPDAFVSKYDPKQSLKSLQRRFELEKTQITFLED